MRFCDNLELIGIFGVCVFFVDMIGLQWLRFLWEEVIKNVFYQQCCKTPSWLPCLAEISHPFCYPPHFGRCNWVLWPHFVLKPQTTFFPCTALKFFFLLSIQSGGSFRLFQIFPDVVINSSQISSVGGTQLFWRSKYPLQGTHSLLFQLLFIHHITD